MSSFMGACICHKKFEHFSMNDLNGIDKYYSLMSKRKADIFMWLIDSKGPWETPESFRCFQRSSIVNTPIKVSNKDEIEICARKSESTLHVDEKQIPTTLNPPSASVPIISSIHISNRPLLDDSSEW